jgi:transposase-like protein
MSTKPNLPPKSAAKTTASTPAAKPKARKPRRNRERREFPAKVKCEAVLAVWSERRKPAEICRELEIPWQQLQNWQNQAMDAMLVRLSPRPSAAEPALNSRLQKLLDQTERKTSRKTRINKRLEDIQDASLKTQENPANPKNPGS